MNDCVVWAQLTYQNFQSFFLLCIHYSLVPPFVLYEFHFFISPWFSPCHDWIINSSYIYIYIYRPMELCVLHYFTVDGDWSSFWSLRAWIIVHQRSPKVSRTVVVIQLKTLPYIETFSVTILLHKAYLGQSFEYRFQGIFFVRDERQPRSVRLFLENASFIDFFFQMWLFSVSKHCFLFNFYFVIRTIKMFYYSQFS